jgi:hypothetical protein
MMQTIFLIMLVMEKRRRGDGFLSYVNEFIDIDIKGFLPDGIHFLSCELFTDFYSANIMDRIYNLGAPEKVHDEMKLKIEVMKLTFSSHEDIMFKELPWLEAYMGEAAEYYDNLGVVFPYLIKDGRGYTFRLSYKMITPITNEDAYTKALEENFSILISNANFFKSHFYKEDIRDEYYSNLAKAMLVHSIKEVE